MGSFISLRHLTPLVGTAAVVAAMLAATAPTLGRVPLAPSITLASGSAPNGIVAVVSADDWATRSYNDPADMSQRTDVSWWSFSDDQPFTFMGLPSIAPCTTTGSSTDPTSRCLRSTTTSSNNPSFYMLETGGPAQPTLGRTGDNYPIDTTKYRRYTMRLRLGGAAQGQLFPHVPSSTMNFIWYEKTMYNSDPITSDTTLVYGGWQIYSIDLPTLAATSPTGPGPNWGQHTVRTFRTNPVRISGVPVEVDWVRLTPSSVQTSTINWSGAGANGIDLYLDSDTNLGNGHQGHVVQNNVVSRATMGGNPTALRAPSGSYTIPVGALSPGQYYVHACSAGSTTDCAVSSWRYRVNAPPLLSFVNPSPEGSTDDFATVQLNDPWDMSALSDIDVAFNTTGLQITSVDATAEDGTSLGNIPVVRGTSLGSGNTGDPYFYPLWFAGDGRGRFKMIDSSRYHIATVELGAPNKKRDLNNGSVARLVWMVDGDTAGENVSTDINLNHTSGENTLAKFTTSMRTLGLALPQPGDPNPSPSRVGWTGLISSFRVDPHEFTPATDFYVHRIKLAANEVTVNHQYAVRWTYTDPDGGSSGQTMTVSYDTDRDPSNGLSGTICTVNPATTSQCTWQTFGVPYGAYYIYASYSDGTNTNSNYGVWPVLVGGETIDPANKPRIVLDKSRIDFGGHFNWPSNATITAPQKVRVSIANAGAHGVAWQAASNHPDVIVSPSFGTGDGEITISMRESNHYPPNLIGDYRVTVTEFSGGVTANSPQALRVMFHMYDTGATAAPTGAFDTPTNGQTGVSGSIAVTGWAVDDIGIDRIEIWRDPVANDPAPPFYQHGHPGHGKVFVANGTTVAGSRPDVEAAFPGYPNNDRSGWGYLLLTWGLPNANGTFVLTAVAWDVEGKHKTLGSKQITVDNANSMKPFGAIDVPAYGSTFSGHQYTFGWALTPAPGCTMANGQLYMTMNSAPPYFPVSYGDYRADIATLFPGFADSANASGAVALDSRNYPNGTHIIGWLVYDSCGNGDGIGSRFFTIHNSDSEPSELPGPTAASALPALPTVPSIASASTTFARLGLPAPRVRGTPPPVRLSRGFNARPSTSLAADRLGSRVVSVQPYDRIELHVSPEAQRVAQRADAPFEAYLVHDGELRALPLGSSFDTTRGIFYWQPLPGFQGDFDLLFQRGKASGDQTPVRVRVTVGGAGY